MKIKAPDFDSDGLSDILWEKGFLDPFAILDLKFVKGKDWGKGGGEWGGYSSTNYVLLGMVLAEATGGAMPDEFDQGLYLPKSLKGYLAFGNNGQKVKDFTHIHVYSKHKGDWWNSAGPMVSWTASDILASGEGYARMIYEIYGTTSITKSGKEMAKQASTIKYGCYGFGTECRWYGKHGDSYCGKSLEGTDYGDLWGHGGSTYGARTVSLYNPTLKIAVSAGMNTDQQDDAVMNAFCLAYNTAINEVLKIPGKRKVSSSCKTFGTCCEPDPVGKSPTPRPGPSTPKPSPGPGPSPSPGGDGCERPASKGIAPSSRPRRGGSLASAMPLGSRVRGAAGLVRPQRRGCFASCDAAGLASAAPLVSCVGSLASATRSAALRGPRFRGAGESRASTTPRGSRVRDAAAPDRGRARSRRR